MYKYYYSVLAILFTVVLCGYIFVNAQNGYNINYLVLVNPNNQLPINWENTIILEKTIDYYGDEQYLEKNTLEKFYELQGELIKHGVHIELESCYRSVQEQTDLWNQFIIQYGEVYTKTYVAPPGYSEHHTGLAIDILIVKDASLKNANKQWEIIYSIMPNYGFILRYPEGKENITGYGHEAWHIRYVGDADIAREISKNGITLEEYLEQF